MILIVTACAIVARFEAQPIDQQPPAWLNKVQTYGMLPVLPERAHELHVTVNGVWAGVGGDDPILPLTEHMKRVRDKYRLDVGDFVADSHRAGLIVPACVQGIEGMPALRATFPDLDEMACRDAEGKIAQTQEFRLMCNNNPRWVAAQRVLGKKAIDEGADLVQLDTPMGSAFLAGGLLKAGFCDSCMDGFKRHLESQFTPDRLRRSLDMAAFDKAAIIRRLRSRQELSPKVRPFVDEAPDDLLYRQFVHFQEQSSFDARKELLDSLRRYAAQKGRAVAFGANAANLGTQNPLGYWIRGLMFADLVDLLIYEQEQVPLGLPDNTLMPLPRGKWAAYHKLAHAVNGRRNPAVAPASSMGKLLMSALLGPGPHKTSWMGVLAAEAYAANGAFVTYYVEPLNNPSLMYERLWKQTTAVHAGVLKDPDLYEGPLRSGSPLAMVFLLNERGRTIPGVFPSYLGFAQALSESGFAYDVVFGGDGHYVKDRLSDAAVSRYRALLVPSPIDPTDNQKAVLRRFVESGGTLVCQEPERLGVSASFGGAPKPCLAGAAALGSGRVWRIRGDVTATASDDPGTVFFHRYDAEARQEIAALGAALGLRPLIEGAGVGTVGVYPIEQPDRRRVVVHLVNYDIDESRDSIREKGQIGLRLPRPKFVTGSVQAQWRPPGEQGLRQLPVEATDGELRVRVPQLGLWGAVIVSGQ